MNDRELLDLSAKAADVRFGFDGKTYAETPGANWNPLVNSSDAFWLMANLKIDIEWETEWVVFADKNWAEDIRNHPDIATAIRRVIVRAAAEIGRAMP